MVDPPSPQKLPTQSSLRQPVAPNVVRPTPILKIAPPARPPRNGPGTSTQTIVPSGPRKSSVTVEKTNRVIFMLTIDVDARRVALWPTDGFAPIRGNVLTDLAVGLYVLTVDQPREQWNISGPQVQIGQRFAVDLVGVENPFNLTYTDKVALLVHKGIPLETREFEKIETRLIDSVYDKAEVSTGKIYDSIVGLPGVDLYDMIDELWSDPEKGQGTIYKLLEYFNYFPKTEHEEMQVVLHALECFAVPPEKLYIDSFTKCYVHPDSYGDHPYIDQNGNADTLLIFLYDDLSPKRLLCVPSREILDTGGPSKGEALQNSHFGTIGLLFPPQLAANSIPRMVMAKRERLAEISVMNFDFVLQSWQGVEMFIYLAGGSANVEPGTGRRPPYKGLKRPVSDAAAKQPGRWEPEFPSRTGTEDSKYEARVCKKDEGLIYRAERNGIAYKFDGEENAGKVLVDAKHWTDNGKQVALMRGDFGLRAFDRFAAKLEERALIQVHVANGRQIKWPVSHPESARMLQEFMNVKKLPINVVYTP